MTDFELVKLNNWEFLRKKSWINDLVTFISSLRFELLGSLNKFLNLEKLWIDSFEFHISITLWMNIFKLNWRKERNNFVCFMFISLLCLFTLLLLPVVGVSVSVQIALLSGCRLSGLHWFCMLNVFVEYVLWFIYLLKE